LVNLPKLAPKSLTDGAFHFVKFLLLSLNFPLFPTFVRRLWEIFFSQNAQFSHPISHKMIKPLIRTKKRKTDGKYLVSLYISHGGRKCYVDSGLYTDSPDLKKGKMTDAVNNDVKNSQLISYISEIDRLLITNPTKPLTSLIPRIKSIVRGLSGDSLNSYILDHISELKKDMERTGIKPAQKKRIAEMVKQYNGFNTRLTNTFGDVYYGEVTHEFYKRFLKSMADLKPNTIGGQIKWLKKFMGMAHADGLHNNLEYQKFKRIREDVDNISLSEADMEKIIEVELPVKLQKERDRFVVSTFLLVRFGDSINLSRQKFSVRNVRGKETVFYKAEHSKTGIGVMVPVKPIVLKILERNNYEFHQEYNAVSNKQLKEIGAYAGLNEVIEVDGERGPKWTFITTHTARRTGATLLYQKTKDLKLVAMMGGWKSLTYLQSYLKISKEDAADFAAGSEFFQ
jgi:integrase